MAAQHWQYHVTQVDLNLGTDAIGDWLTTIGREGWELVAVVPVVSTTQGRGHMGYGTVGGPTSTHAAAAQFFLKRPSDWS